MTKYRHGAIYKRTNIVSTIYRPVTPGMVWYAKEYDEEEYANKIDINNTDISLDVLKNILAQAIYMAKDIEDIKLSNLRSFLQKQGTENARFNALVNSWSPKELIYYGYRFNNSDLATFNRILAEEKGLNVSFNFANGLDVNVLLDGQIASTVSFSDKQFDFFIDRMMNNEVNKAKGILFEEYVKNFKVPTSYEKTQDGVIKKQILRDSIGSEMGVVDFLYTGIEELTVDGIAQYKGKRELMPVDIKFSSKTDGMLSIFKGIRTSNLLLKMEDGFPQEFREMGKFKTIFVEWLRQEISAAMIDEADTKIYGSGVRKYRDSLKKAFENNKSSITKALTISMALYKIVNNITELVKGNAYMNEFPVFVLNPGLFGLGSSKKIISDIIFSSELLDGVYASLFDGEHVLSTKPVYGLTKGLNVSVAARPIRQESFNKAIVSSGADVPVQLGEYEKAINRHQRAIQGVISRTVLELNYGKMGG